MRKKISAVIIYSSITLAATAILMTRGAIPQDASYHNFADQSSIAGIPNFINVVSNICFIVSGILGIIIIRDKNQSDSFIEKTVLIPYTVFSIGLIMTGLGSAYYHLAPDNFRLVWDRIPMTIIFMSFFSSLVVERINARAGLLSLPILLLLGTGSVIYWYCGEAAGTGDLRPYAIVQFYPILSVPLIMMLFPSRYTHGGFLITAALLYTAAKGMELLDGSILAATCIISGHTLKHITASAASYLIFDMLKRRTISVEHAKD